MIRALDIVIAALMVAAFALSREPVAAAAAIMFALASDLYAGAA